MAKRRTAWFVENGPCVDCGSDENLRLDHKDASQKVSHRIWSWSDDRRLAELAKCVVRCYPCHIVKTNNCNEHTRGEQRHNAVLTAEIVREARILYSAGGVSWPQLGRMFEVKHDTLRRACKDWWQHVEA